MTEYIDKETAVHCTDGELSITGEENMLAVADYIQNVVQRLRQAPGIEIVLCRDCKYKNGRLCYEWGSETEMNAFCSYGERMEE